MKTALYSTLYPAITPYLEPFFNSIDRQSDQDFDLCLGLDGFDEKLLEPFLNREAHCIPAKGDTIASMRERALLEICKSYDAVILVDSDDILLPNRVKRGREALKTYDAYACALELIDETATPLNLTFQANRVSSWESYLSRVNVFGFSNAAYRADVLAACFPIARETVMVDWLVASQVLAQNHSLYFDAEPHMLYRQYGANTARVISPFTAEQITRACLLVLGHYDYLLDLFKTRAPQNELFQEELIKRQRGVKRFFEFMQDEAKLRAYTEKINYLKATYSWWEMVAHPDLESLWQ